MWLDYSPLELFVFFDLSFIIKKTTAYEDKQNRAVMPVYTPLVNKPPGDRKEDLHLSMRSTPP